MGRGQLAMAAGASHGCDDGLNAGVPAAAHHGPLRETLCRRFRRERAAEPGHHRQHCALRHLESRQGLVDEYRLIVYPVVHGRGRRLIPDGFELPGSHCSRQELPRRHLLPIPPADLAGPSHKVLPLAPLRRLPERRRECGTLTMMQPQGHHECVRLIALMPRHQGTTPCPTDTNSTLMDRI